MKNKILIIGFRVKVLLDSSNCMLGLKLEKLKYSHVHNLFYCFYNKFNQHVLLK